MEYIIWKESSKLFQMDFSTLSVPETAPSLSLSDGVMARLAREDKWTFPLTAHVFAISPSVKRWMTTISVIFLLVFGVLAYGTFHWEQTSASDQGQVEWKEIPSSRMVIGFDQLVASPSPKGEDTDMKYKLIASIGDPLNLDLSLIHI